MTPEPYTTQKEHIQWLQRELERSEAERVLLTLRPCPTCARYREALERIVAASDDPDLYDQCGNIARKALATDAAERGEA